jgi:O-antigen/teichoic acid export membrane protein
MSDIPLVDSEPLDASTLQRRAISGSLWTGVHTLVSVPIAFAANAVVARALGVTDYGQLAFLTATLTLAMQFANFGFSPALIQWGSAAEARGLRTAADSLLRRSLGFHTMIELPILATLAIILTRDNSWWIAGMLLVAVSVACVFSGAVLSVTIENRTAANAKLAIVTNLVIQSASVIVALVTGSAVAVWATRTAVSAFGVALILVVLTRSRRSTVLRPALPRGFGAGFWRFASVTWIAGVIALLVFSRSEVFLLKAFHKDQALGVFALAFGLSQQLTAPADSMLLALMPAVAGVLSAWPERAAAAFERATRVSALACGALTVAVVPTLVFLLPLIYGHAFHSAAWLLVPLALVSCFQSVNNAVTAFVNARRRAGVILTANSAALAVNVVVAIALIPRFGAWGAVAANVTGQLVAILALARSEPLIRDRSLATLIRAYRPFLLSLGVIAVVLPVCALLLQWSGVIAAIAACGLASSAYIVALRLSNSGLTVGDRDALIGSVSEQARPHVVRLLKPVTASTP